MSPAYDLQKIRTLMGEGFMAEELIDFCRVFPQFQPLYDQDLTTLSESELIDRLVTYARDISQLEKLLAWAKKRNPIQYAAYEPYMADGVSTDVEAQVKAAADRFPQTGSETSLPTQTTTTDSALADENSSQVSIKEVGGSIENATIAGRDVERTTVRQVIQNVFRGSKRKSPAQRNRQAILKRVRSHWVEGVLEKSLHGLAMIELGLAEKAEVVDDPLNLTLKTTDQPDELLPDGTQINDIFNEMGRALLILGEPGSGKTMSLLALARDAIAEAEADPTKPLPVVFNLSSWSGSQEPVDEWLVDEFRVKYQIPAKISKDWIEKRDLLLLLDGLDEVAQNERNACVAAINSFSQDYGLKNIVVCSRIADYEVLTGQLKLRGAILIQPLSSEQVDDYLIQAGDQLEAVKRLIEEDEIMRELTHSPLTLSIMTLAYRGMSVEELRGYGSVEERRTHLFDTYIDKMFNRTVRTKQETTYTNELTQSWLSWLAGNMSQHSQSIFLLEQLQPSWLPNRIMLTIYFLVTRIIEGLLIWVNLAVIFMMIFGLAFWLTGGVVIALDAGRNVGQLDDILRTGINMNSQNWLLFGLGGGIILGFAMGIIDRFRPAFQMRSARMPARVVSILMIGIFVGFVTIFFLGTIENINLVTLMPTIIAIVTGAVFGTFFGLKNENANPRYDIQTVEALSWSLSKARRSLVLAAKISLPASLIVVLAYGWYSTYQIGVYGFIGSFFRTLFPTFGYNFSLISVAVTIGLAAAVALTFGGLNSQIIETKSTVNQGIRLSLRNALLVGSLFTIIYGICGLFFVIPIVRSVENEYFYHTDYDPLMGVGVGLGLGLSAGILGALWYGISDLIRHSILRLMLYVTGRTPLNYEGFLDYAQERIFVRKIGGSYIFIHRLLLEHFSKTNIPPNTFNNNKLYYLGIPGLIIPLIALLCWPLVAGLEISHANEISKTESLQSISIGKTASSRMPFDSQTTWTFQGEAGQFIELDLHAYLTDQYELSLVILDPDKQTLGDLQMVSLGVGYALYNSREIIKFTHNPNEAFTTATGHNILLSKTGTYTIIIRNSKRYSEGKRTFIQHTDHPLYKLFFTDEFDYTLTLTENRKDRISVGDTVSFKEMTYSGYHWVFEGQANQIVSLKLSLDLSKDDDSEYDELWVWPVIEIYNRDMTLIGKWSGSIFHRGKQYSGSEDHDILTLLNGEVVSTDNSKDKIGLFNDTSVNVLLPADDDYIINTYIDKGSRVHDPDLDNYLVSEYDGTLSLEEVDKPTK